MSRSKKTKRELLEELATLETENKRLLDENESLWQMLDEMTASDIKNYANLIEEFYKEKKLDSLMISTKKAEAWFHSLFT